MFMLHWPFEVFFLLGEACPSEGRSGLAQVTNKIIAEVEGHCVLIRQQPPNATTLKEEETDGYYIRISGLKWNLLNELLRNSKRRTLPAYLWEAAE